MKRIYQQFSAMLCCTVLCSAVTGCVKADGSNRPAESSSAAETTVSVGESTTTTGVTFQTEEESGTSETTTRSTETTAAAETPAGGAVQLLWSDRGLEPIASGGEGFGEPLAIGSVCNGWKLQSLEGTASGGKVAAMHAVFVCEQGVSAHATLIASSGGLTLRVENLRGNFPFFEQPPANADCFQVANADEVKQWVEPEGTLSGECSVEVKASKLELSIGSGENTITLAYAAKR